VTVSNEGASTLSVTSVSLSGGDAAHFGLVDDSPFTLAPGESRNVTIEFAPTARIKAATIAVESDGPDESTVSASLTSNATAEVTNHAPIAADDHYILIQGETLSVSGPASSRTTTTRTAMGSSRRYRRRPRTEPGAWSSTEASPTRPTRTSSGPIDSPTARGDSDEVR